MTYCMFFFRVKRQNPLRLSQPERVETLPDTTGKRYSEKNSYNYKQTYITRMCPQANN